MVFTIVRSISSCEAAALADPFGRDAAEELADRWETAANDDEVGFDDAVE